MIGIDDVLEARIASGGRSLVRAPEDVLLHFCVLDDRLDQEIGRDDRVDGRDSSEDVVRRRPALLGEPGEALLHGSERPLDGTGSLVVQRHAAPGGRHHLRDPASHLPGPHDQHVLELHARILGLGRTRKVGSRSLAQA